MKKRKHDSLAPQSPLTVLRSSIKPVDSSISLQEVKPTSLFDVKSFLSETFRKSAMHLKGGALDKLGCFDGLKMTGRLYEETASENGVHVWLLDRATSKIKSILVDAEQAKILHGAGHATYCRAPGEVEEILVSNFLSDLGIGCGRYEPSGEGWGKGEVEIFVGTNGHFTDFHFDFQENFTIQLSGSKKWRIKKGSVPSPILGATPHYLSEAVVEGQIKAARLGDSEFQFAPPDCKDSEVEEVLVEAGDIWYFPAGMWHSVETVDPGVSMNISLMGKSYADIFCDSLKGYLRRDDAWRSLVLDDVHNGKLAVNNLQDLIDSKAYMGKLGLHSSMIVPPVVSARRALVVQEEEEEEEEGGLELGEGWDEVEEEKGLEGVEVSSVCDDEDIQDDDEEEDSDDIDNLVIDIDNDQCKTKLKKTKKNSVIRNPLALILREEEVNRYFRALTNHKKNKKDGCTRQSISQRYIVNVDFAGGDEMMKSTTRAILVANKDGEGMKLIEKVLKGGTITERDQNIEAFHWLIFLGVVVFAA